jgi:predicted hotdog family 3-hydroxylacyl-ACP dehydratase
MSNPQPSPDSIDIRQLIPHHGKMCVLAGVRHYDEQSIRCYSTSHHAPDNPLRENNQLHAVCGVEYAAQAMAVHGALTSQQNNGTPRAGRLAGVRSVELHTHRLDDINAPLEVEATKIMGNENSMVYEFTIHAAQRLLLKGKATVMLLT